MNTDYNEIKKFHLVLRMHKIYIHAYLERHICLSLLYVYGLYNVHCVCVYVLCPASESP